MTCGHCIFSCTHLDKSGEHLSLHYFKKALKIAEQTNQKINFGGGEPTIHPNFWEMFALAMESTLTSVWLATNGKKTRRTLALIELHGRKFKITVSKDEWHEDIDQRIWDKCKAFGVEVRSNKRISKNGFAITNRVFNTEDCECADLHIHADGNVKICACESAPVLWNIFEEDLPVDIAKLITEASLSNGCITHWTQHQKDALYNQIHSKSSG